MSLGNKRRGGVAFSENDELYTVPDRYIGFVEPEFYSKTFLVKKSTVMAILLPIELLYADAAKGFGQYRTHTNPDLVNAYKTILALFRLAITHRYLVSYGSQRHSIKCHIESIPHKDDPNRFVAMVLRISIALDVSPDETIQDLFSASENYLANKFVNRLHIAKPAAPAVEGQIEPIEGANENAVLQRKTKAIKESAFFARQNFGENITKDDYLIAAALVTGIPFHWGRAYLHANRRPISSKKNRACPSELFHVFSHFRYLKLSKLNAHLDYCFPKNYISTIQVRNLQGVYEDVECHTFPHPENVTEVPVEHLDPAMFHRLYFPHVKKFTSIEDAVKRDYVAFHDISIPDELKLDIDVPSSWYQEFMQPEIIGEAIYETIGNSKGAECPDYDIEFFKTWVKGKTAKFEEECSNDQNLTPERKGERRRALQKECISEFHKYIWRESGAVSNPVKAIVKEYKKMLLTNFNFCMPRQKMTKNMSHLADFMILLSVNLEFLYRVNFAPMFTTIITLLLSGHEIYFREALHNNVVIFGMQDLGKSFALKVFAKMLVPGTYKMVAHQTLSSRMVGGREEDNMIEINEEFPASSMGIDPSGKAGKGYDSKNEQISTMKNLMTSTTSQVERNDWRDGQSNRSTEIAHNNIVRCGATNASVNDVAPTFVSRLNIRIAQREDERKGRRVHNLHSNNNKNFAQALALWEKRMMRNQIFCCMLGYLIYSEVLIMDLTVAESFINTVFSQGKKKVDLATPPDRDNIRVMCLVRVLILWEAIDAVLDNLDSALVKQNGGWKPEYIIFLEPYLFSRVEHATIALGLLENQYEDPILFNVVETMIKIINISDKQRAGDIVGEAVENKQANYQTAASAEALRKANKDVHKVQTQPPVDEPSAPAQPSSSIVSLNFLQHSGGFNSSASTYIDASNRGEKLPRPNPNVLNPTAGVSELKTGEPIPKQNHEKKSPPLDKNQTSILAYLACNDTGPIRPPAILSADKKYWMMQDVIIPATSQLIVNDFEYIKRLAIQVLEEIRPKPRYEDVIAAIKKVREMKVRCPETGKMLDVLYFAYSRFGLALDFVKNHVRNKFRSCIEDTLRHPFFQTCDLLYGQNLVDLPFVLNVLKYNPTNHRKPIFVMPQGDTFSDAILESAMNGIEFVDYSKRAEKEQPPVFGLAIDALEEKRPEEKKSHVEKKKEEVHPKNQLSEERKQEICQTDPNLLVDEDLEAHYLIRHLMNIGWIGKDSIGPQYHATRRLWQTIQNPHSLNVLKLYPNCYHPKDTDPEEYADLPCESMKALSRPLVRTLQKNCGEITNLLAKMQPQYLAFTSSEEKKEGVEILEEQELEMPPDYISASEVFSSSDNEDSKGEEESVIEIEEYFPSPPKEPVSNKRSWQTTLHDPSLGLDDSMEQKGDKRRRLNSPPPYEQSYTVEDEYENNARDGFELISLGSSAPGGPRSYRSPEPIVEGPRQRNETIPNHKRNIAPVFNLARELI